MKSLVLKISALVLFAAVVGCRAESKKLEAPILTYSEAEQSAALQTVDVVPKVDIMILVDYSTSMTRHQANLAANIDQFVNEFKKHTLIDYQIGVLPMYDHVHCLDGKQAPPVQNGWQVGYCYPLGELLPLKDANRQELPGPRFVTKSTPDAMNVLKNTILMGEKAGPAYEEMFSPVIPALTAQNFYRGKFLIVIFITDGDDSDGPVSISAEQMANALIQVTGDRAQLSTVGVLSLTKDAECAKDQSAPRGPKKIEELVAKTNGKLLSLCSSQFGKELSNIGKDLSVRVAKQKISLNGNPDFSNDQEFEVYHGQDKIKRAQAPNFEDGWKYDPENRVIEIGSQTVFKEGTEAKITVKMTPISLQNMINGKVKQMEATLPSKK